MSQAKAPRRSPDNEAPATDQRKGISWSIVVPRSPPDASASASSFNPKQLLFEECDDFNDHALDEDEAHEAVEDYEAIKEEDDRVELLAKLGGSLDDTIWMSDAQSSAIQEAINKSVVAASEEFIEFEDQFEGESGSHTPIETDPSPVPAAPQMSADELELAQELAAAEKEVNMTEINYDFGMAQASEGNHNEQKIYDAASSSLPEVRGSHVVSSPLVSPMLLL
jgi:hypothetical protein